MKKNIIFQDMQNIYNRDIPWEDLKNKKILITGAYGMLASYIIYMLIYLNEKFEWNMEIFCQGRTESKMKNRYGEYMNRKYFHYCDFSLCKEIEINVRVDYLIHAASLANPSYYENNPIEVAEPNAIGTYYLLEYANKCSVEGFLYFSSGDIYGYVEGMDKNITENTYGIMDPLNAHSCYGESKRMGETWCAAFASEKVVPVTIARIGHTYGPTMDIENDPRVFASFMKDVIYGKDIIMNSDGLSYRPFCYIADATAAFFLILLKGKCGEAYNVCNTEQFISIRELAEILAGLRKDVKINVVMKKRTFDESYLEDSVNRANRPVEFKLKQLGWKAQYDVKAGFTRVMKALMVK